MRYYHFSLIVILLSSSCGGKSETPKPTEQAKITTSQASPQLTPIAKEVEKSVSEIIGEQPFLDKQKRPALLRAWKQIPHHDVYRAVLPSDFRIPDWVRNQPYGADVIRGTGWHSDYGEMSGAYGLIAFVIDKTVTDTNRFSVVVFIERPGNQYSVHWIKRNEDLSRVVLGRHSGNVYFQEFREDGTSRSCDVQWSRTTARWGCNLEGNPG